MASSRRGQPCFEKTSELVEVFYFGGDRDENATCSAAQPDAGRGKPRIRDFGPTDCRCAPGAAVGYGFFVDFDFVRSQKAGDALPCLSITTDDQNSHQQCDNYVKDHSSCDGEQCK